VTYNGLDIVWPQQTRRVAVSQSAAKAEPLGIDLMPAWSHYADRSQCPVYRPSEILGWDQGRRVGASRGEVCLCRSNFRFSNRVLDSRRQLNSASRQAKGEALTRFTRLLLPIIIGSHLSYSF
jgi:hypothetical protein